MLRPEIASRRFDADVRQVGAARRFALDTAAGWGIEPRDLAIVVGELAANAVLHGGTPFTVSLERRDQTVGVEVADASPGGVPNEAAPSDSTGRGLVIVDRLVLEWGMRPAPRGGKVVWAELDG